MQVRAAGGAHFPAPHTSTVEDRGQKSTDDCQAGVGAVAPFGRQFEQGEVPLQALKIAGWLALSERPEGEFSVETGGHPGSGGDVVNVRVP
jgi:hypothetical protein